MGLLDSFLPGNPVSSWLDPNRGKVVGMFSGMAGAGNDPRAAIQGATQGLTQGMQRDDAYAQILKAEEEKRIAQEDEAARQNATIQWLRENAPEYAGAVEAGVLDPGKAYEMSLGLGGGDTSYSMTPVFLSDGKGNTQAAQMSSSGGILFNGELLPGIPEGWSVSARPENLDNVNLGGSMGVFDPNTGTYRQGPAIQGSPSANMDVMMGPDGGRSMTPAAGSPEAREMTGQQVKATSAMNALEAKNEIVVGAIDSALGQANWTNTGNVMGNSGWVPVFGQGALDLGKTLETIKANIGFEELQTMRDSSPTGGALGQVTERELSFLQSTIANIEQAQSEEQLKANLKLLREFIVGSKQRRQEAYRQQYGGGALPPAAGGGATLVYNPATGELE